MLGLLAVALMQAAVPRPPLSSLSQEELRHFITSPDWVAKPNGDDLANFYPKAARKAHLEGRAVILCEIAATGYLLNCRVTSETPPGEGFGEAALAMAPRFKMTPLTRDGRPVGGGLINIPIQFRLPGPPPSPPEPKVEH